MVIKTLLKTLSSGQNSLTFTDEECDDNMIYDVFVESLDLFPINVSVTGHTVTVNFKDAAIGDMNVKIVVNALDGSLDGSDIPYDNTDTSLTSDNVEDAIDELDNNISANVSDIEQLQLDMVQAQSDIAGKADLFAVDESLMLSEGILSTEASIIPFDNTLIGIVSEDVQGAIEEAYNHGWQILYSTSEEEIGIWFGKKLYRRGYIFDNDVTISYSSWQVIIDLTVKLVTNCFCVSTSGAFYPLQAYPSNPTQIAVLSPRNNANATAKYLVIEYTKD